uniref:Leucine-rich repeat-containing N-terminal plant-type domain-containing protein n=1 Tax=Populus trichocarpa TaxID=3694 RepID=A0A3N7G7I6_POPTR
MMMKKMGAWMLLALLTLVGDWCGRCYGCLEEERIGLLEIKPLFDPNSIYMRDWVEYSSNCCEWYGIECDNTTRRVIHLSLWDATDFLLGDWVLNASLFLPFKELQSLDLSFNGLVGCSENEGFEVLPSKLEVLDLTRNRFNNDKGILSCFNGISALKSLDLSDNQLTGSGLKVLSSRLKKLENLHLSANQCNDSIFSSITGFSSLKSLDLSYNEVTGSGLKVLSSRLQKLENLHLSGNQCNDSIFSSITGFSSLKSLDLSDNQVTGSGLKVLSSRLKRLENLDLSGNQCNDSIFSSLSGFSSLKYLNLSKNQLTGSSTGINSFQVLVSGLRNLEELHLYSNKLNNNILSSLSGFSTLKSLDLSDNMFTGSTGLNGLRNLETLYLDSTDFKESILIESLGALPSLKTLDASYSNFTHFGKGLCNSSSLEEVFLDDSSLPASFLRNIGPLSTLKVLSLAGVDFNSTLPAQGWCELKNLEELYLSGNNLKGVLPPCLGNLSFLQILDLSHNQLEGNIAFSYLSHLKQLRSLSIKNNYFQVPISFGSFMNLSNLKLIACDNNELIAAPSFQPSAPKFQLLFFSASNCTPKPLKAGFTNFLHSQYDLMFVDLSHNKFVGEPFPSWLFENNRKLNRLYLRDTSITGPLQLPQHPTPYLQTVDISGNTIHGQIARNICSIFPRLKNFLMANNSLTGCIPRCFGNMSSLEFLDLSNNHMSCELLEHNLPTVGSLWSLQLSNNNFSGRLPPSVFNMTYLLYLLLDGNKFVGEVPGTFSLESSLLWLDISNNLLSGMLPRGIGNSSKNQLDGIDLSRNHFEDLGDNNLTGPIPNWIDSLSELSIFVLKSNQFNGKLPHQLCLLRKLSILDLSENNFSGLLPSCLSNLNLTASDEKTSVEPDWGSRDYWSEEEMFSSMGGRGFSPSDTMLWPEISVKIAVELTAKKNFYTYEGGILRYMSALDLSCNRFTGEIPTEWGNLSGIYSLNLSQNNLTGLIPSSFSNLKHIESLDLSHNNLNGRIPAQLVELTFLAVFNVSYNNLSGRTPEMKNQFGTFDESSYKGNPLLCGPPLQNSCDKTESPSARVPNDCNGDGGFIDMYSFYASFGVCYIIAVLTIAAVLCINPHWRRRWFYFIEECIDTCFCFLAINFRKLSRFRR